VGLNTTIEQDGMYISYSTRRVQEFGYLEVFDLEIVIYCRDISVGKVHRQMSCVKRGEAHVQYWRVQWFYDIVYEFKSRDDKRANAPVVFDSCSVSFFHLFKHNA
jgi:hypothetical protein